MNESLGIENLYQTKRGRRKPPGRGENQPERVHLRSTFQPKLSSIPVKSFQMNEIAQGEHSIVPQCCVYVISYRWHSAQKAIVPMHMNPAIHLRMHRFRIRLFIASYYSPLRTIAKAFARNGSHRLIHASMSDCSSRSISCASLWFGLSCCRAAFGAPAALISS